MARATLEGLRPGQLAAFERVCLSPIMGFSCLILCSGERTRPLPLFYTTKLYGNLGCMALSNYSFILV